MQARKRVLQEYDLAFLIQLAEELFGGSVLEEKVFAVFLLEKLTDKFGDAEFRRFESWLDRISSWADHDGLVHSLIGPMIVNKPTRSAHAFKWAKSPNRWRAACVGLIHAIRRKQLFPEAKRLSDMLLADKDDMVKKGLGWLLREAGKADARTTVPYLMKIRERAPRLVFRTACETLPNDVRKRVMGR